MCEIKKIANNLPVEIIIEGIQYCFRYANLTRQQSFLDIGETVESVQDRQVPSFNVKHMCLVWKLKILYF